MRCYFCNRAIAPDELHQHHVIPKSEGGTATVPSHKTCHIAHHRSKGHFRAWGSVGGKLSAITRRWAFSLRGVKDNPAYELDRQFYRLYYAEAV
jgi:hypothetical protein